ncbi:hypothetical protein AGMMS49545_16810 [Betaproteobacteria bacterium]|nr:hypothetical protein AGMMS49545_16810 [Betaproteobacteria bacterium]GHU46627.1 hypothetical protein AGMMS50289_20440 [Betaproteobacteria bacterium]
MIFGDPDKFAILFDIVEEWNDDLSLWKNGVFFIYVDGIIIPSTLNTFELRTTLAVFNTLEADMFYGNKIYLPKNDLIEMIRGYSVGCDEPFDKNYFIELLNKRVIWEISGCELEDQKYFVFVIKDSISESIVWSDPQAGFHEKTLPIGTVGYIAKNIQDFLAANEFLTTRKK